MKKTINQIIIMAFFIIMSCTTFITASPITESNSNPVIEVIQLNNGDYIEITIEESTSPISLLATTQTKSGRKTAAYKNSAGTIMWSVTVHGTFSYVKGVSSKCTKSTVTTTCPSSSWKITNSSATRSGNTATSKATAKKYVDGTAVDTITRSISLSCSKNGTLS